MQLFRRQWLSRMEIEIRQVRYRFMLRWYLVVNVPGYSPAYIRAILGGTRPCPYALSRRLVAMGITMDSFKCQRKSRDNDDRTYRDHHTPVRILQPQNSPESSSPIPALVPSTQRGSRTGTAVSTSKTAVTGRGQKNKITARFADER